MLFGQRRDSLFKASDSKGTVKLLDSAVHKVPTVVNGQVLDASTMQPLPSVTVSFAGGQATVKTDGDGRYSIMTKAKPMQLKFSSVGFKTVIKLITPGKTQTLNIMLAGSDNQLGEVSVHVTGKTHYKNKDNPAVSLIQQVIDHKNANSMQNADYLEYHQYERINFSFFDLPEKFLKSKVFSKYKFLLDSTMMIGDSIKTALPVYMGEKYSDVYSREMPSKTIRILRAHKEVNYSTLIDSAALDIYLNRLYGNPDIYANNIFVLTNQFLSPIADHAPEFYKFFITDTLKTGKEKLVEISFTPRNLGDLLFEGKLYITMDGRYAVKSDLLSINKHININFVRRMDIRQDFQQYPDGRFYLSKSNVQSDFGLMKKKGTKVLGNRAVSYTGYKLHSPLTADFYQGKVDQVAFFSKAAADKPWDSLRTDSLSGAQKLVYRHIDSLQTMPSYKRTVWLAKFVTAGYADIVPVQLGPNGSFYSFNSLEGSRISIGGRTTKDFNHNIYLEGYTAYGLKDQKWKYCLATTYAFNGNPAWGYPSNYLKLSYQYDTDIPGQNFLIDKFQSILGSFTRGKNDLWLYNRIFKANYVRDFPDHLSFNIGLKYWYQNPADNLVFQTGKGERLSSITTSEISLGLRYAPYEQIFMGSENRHTIKSKYPIFSMQAAYGAKGVLGSGYNYLSLGANIYKRFYLSQLGYSDITLLGGSVLGRVPFPLLSILPANQTYLYDKSAYNSMNFLEFVSDHYIGLDITHAFGGFLLNKVPLIKHLKLREFVSGKIIYGGLRAQNNPFLHPDLFRFPSSSSGSQSTFPLGNAPYAEVGLGIGNILKVLRVDVIKRIGYLNHPGVSPIGLRFTIGTEL